MPHADLLAQLLPVLIVIAGALVALGAEPFLGRAAKHGWLPWISAGFLVAAGVAQAFTAQLGGFGQLHGLFAMDNARMWLCGAVIASTLCAIGGIQQTLARDDYAGGEPYALTLFAAAGAMLMVMATDLLALFVALETASLAVYALVGLRRHRAESNEALFKYFVMGSVFSAILLYGIALTYGATGSTHLGVPAVAGREKLLLLGQMLLAIGLLFKVGAVPFHFWSPDAYAGAPAAITGFMGAVIKIGGFAALGAMWLHLVAVSGGAAGPVGPLALDASVAVTAKAREALREFQLVFLLLGLMSVVLGNFAALKQTGVRRLIAYSSVAHAGYMLLAFALPTHGELALGSLWLYLVGYGIATAAALSAIAAMSGAEDAGDTLGGLAGQGRAMPLQGLVLTVFLASFAGVPPTIGFLGKFLVFQDLVTKGWWMVALFAMLMAVVGAAYYLRLTVAIWATPAKEPARTGPMGLTSWTVSAAAIATILLIAAPNMLYAPQKRAATTAATAPADLAPAMAAVPAP